MHRGQVQGTELSSKKWLTQTFAQHENTLNKDYSSSQQEEPLIPKNWKNQEDTAWNSWKFTLTPRTEHPQVPPDPSKPHSPQRWGGSLPHWWGLEALQPPASRGGQEIHLKTPSQENILGLEELLCPLERSKETHGIIWVKRDLCSHGVQALLDLHERRKREKWDQKEAQQLQSRELQGSPVHFGRCCSEGRWLQHPLSLQLQLWTPPKLVLQ